MDTSAVSCRAAGSIAGLTSVGSGLQLRIGQRVFFRVLGYVALPSSPRHQGHSWPEKSEEGGQGAEVSSYVMEHALGWGVGVGSSRGMGVKRGRSEDAKDNHSYFQISQGPFLYRGKKFSFSPFFYFYHLSR